MFKIYDGREQFYQWDVDRKIIVDDAAITQVHFCNKTDSCSLVCETYQEDGLTLVNVPNILLQTDWRINVYAYDRNYTKFSKCFNVVRRSKPESYVYTETEVLNYNILLDKMNSIEENIGEAVEDYIKEHPVEVDLTGYATENYVIELIEEIELTPGPQGPIGETGPQGEPGYTPIKGIDYFDGKDGYTPIKGIDYFDGAPGKDGKDGTMTFEDLTEEQKASLKGDPGEPGKDGAPGKDGYTPVKGVDYFDGAPGERGETGPAGPQGEPGADYVLTDADKQEIAGMIDIPSGGGGGDWVQTWESYDSGFYNAKEICICFRDTSTSNYITVYGVAPYGTWGDSPYMNFIIPHYEYEESWYYDGSSICPSGNFEFSWAVYK